MKKRALVIGNQDYEYGKLSKPVNDANDITSFLHKVSFSVEEKHNLTQKGFWDAIGDFCDNIDNVDVRLFYFSGHGINYNGKNYLIPVDVIISRGTDINSCIDLDLLIDNLQIDADATNIIILDCCNANPSNFKFKNSGEGIGFNQISTPTGTIIGYAAKKGSLALSYNNMKNSVYTSMLLKHLRTPNLKIEQVFKNTIKDVQEYTNRGQNPAFQSDFTGDFCFIKNEDDDFYQLSLMDKFYNLANEYNTLSVNNQFIRVENEKELRNKLAKFIKDENINIHQIKDFSEGSIVGIAQFIIQYAKEDYHTLLFTLSIHAKSKHVKYGLLLAIEKQLMLKLIPFEELNNTLSIIKILGEYPDKNLRKKVGALTNQIIYQQKNEEFGIGFQLNDQNEIIVDKAPTVIVSYRIAKSFPGVRKLKWFRGSEAIEGLKRFFRFPLSGKVPISHNHGLYSQPIWWFRAGAALSITEFEDLGEGKVLIGFDELKVDKIAIYRSPSYNRSFIYLQTLADEPIGVYNYEEDSVPSEEEFGLYGDIPIKREELDDGAAYINGKYTETRGAKLRIRYLQPYNFIIAAYSSPYNDDEGDNIGRIYMDLILQDEKQLDKFIKATDSIPKNIMDY